MLDLFIKDQSKTKVNVKKCEFINQFLKGRES